ncbi:sensor domain-containing diguanylate cyclase [Celerinatantimonas yamalensis]|uniref:Diguanylate cyclase n=1 Tax=Celerinatantimonas yamalensis TaxID=559956 RepID=A0ABW9GAG1_9GAMM
MDQLSILVFPLSWLLGGGSFSIVVILLIWLNIRRGVDATSQSFARNSISAMLIINERTQHILFANPYAQELLPLMRQGRHWEFVPNELVDSLFAVLNVSEEPSKGVQWLLPKGKSSQVVRLYACQGRYLGKKVWFISGYNDDVAYQQKTALTKQVKQLYDAFNSLPNFTYYRDLDGRLLGCNQAWAHYRGLLPQDVVGKYLADILTQDELQYEQSHANRVLEGDTQAVQDWLVMENGKRCLIETNYYPLRDGKQNLRGILSVSTDVTNWYQLNQALEQENQQRLLTEKALNKQNNLIRSVFNASPDPIGFIDDHGVITGGNQPFAQLFNLEQRELINRSLSELLPVDDATFHLEQNLSLFHTGASARYEQMMEIPSTGETAWYEICKAPYHDRVSEERGIVIIARDISERKKTEKKLAEAVTQLEALSFLDGLTQVANRRSFDERLPEQWNIHQRGEQPLSLLMIDIDCFKEYNDNYGHQLGDDVLRQVANMVKTNVKRNSDLVARYGGEEFVVLMPQTDLDGAILIAKRLLAQTEDLAIIHEYSQVTERLTISIGVACASSYGNYQPADLLQTADLCLYQAKREGRNTYRASQLKNVRNLPSFSSRGKKSADA